MDITKLRRQEQAVDLWGSKGKGTLEYCMRFGKTYTGILIIQKLLSKRPDALVYIVTPSDYIRNNWFDELVKHNILNVYVKTCNEVLNLDSTINVDLLVVDEIHKYTSDERLKIIRGEIIKYRWNLGLTGTFPTGKIGDEISKYFPIIDTITEHEALQNKWISNFVEYNYGLKLSDEDKYRYLQYSIPIRETLDLFKGTSKLYSFFKDDYDVLTSCFAGKKTKSGYIQAKTIRQDLASKKGWSTELPLTNDYNRMIEDNWNPIIIEQNARKFNDIVRKRNDIINNNRVKLRAVIDICNRFKLTTIIFNESTDFADIIADELNIDGLVAICYHSNIESKFLLDKDGNQMYTLTGKPKKVGKVCIKKEALEGLKNGKYRVLSTAKALDEGLDVPNIELVITTAGTTNPLQYKQRNARGKTVDIYNPDKVTKIINLYFTNFVDDNGNTIPCRDYQKLMLRQSMNDIVPIDITNIDDIN